MSSGDPSGSLESAASIGVGKGRTPGQLTARRTGACPSAGAQLLGQLVAICDADRVARPEVLRGIRDAFANWN